MLKHARVPILSLATLATAPLHGTRALRIRLTEDETRAFDRRVRERAKLAETSVMVFAGARLYDAILRARGLAPAQHLIPVPLSLDPKAGATRMFGNNLTMMTFALQREDLSDLPRAIATLADQQRAIVREKLDVGMLASLDFAKPVPAPLYHWFLTRPFDGEVSSFVFSNPGPATITTFAGLPVTDAYALPTVATPPWLSSRSSRATPAASPPSSASFRACSPPPKSPASSPTSAPSSWAASARLSRTRTLGAGNFFRILGAPLPPRVTRASPL